MLAAPAARQARRPTSGRRPPAAAASAASRARPRRPAARPSPARSRRHRRRAGRRRSRTRRPARAGSTNTGRSRRGSGIARAIAQQHRGLDDEEADTSAAISRGCAAPPRSRSLMPTAMKNRPSSRPLNGSMSVSSSRRYSLSASSTPARKAPSAIDRPTACISAAVATTSSSDAAVKISGVAAARRSSAAPGAAAAARRARWQRSRRAPWPRRASRRRWHATPAAASSGTRARIGMAATSCSSATLSTLWPEVVAIRLRSASTPRPIAVDDIARPSAATSASRQSTPASSAAPNSSAAEPTSCTLPQPKIGLRSDHSRARLELQPDEEQHQHDAELGEVQDLLRVGDERQAPGPDGDAGDEVADDRAQPEQPRQRHGQARRRRGRPGGP